MADSTVSAFTIDPAPSATGGYLPIIEGGSPWLNYRIAIATLVATALNATPVTIAQGGTGSTTKQFVDLTTAQTVAGIKTFSSPPVMSGSSIGSGTIPNTSLVTTPLDTSATTQTKSGSLNLTGMLAMQNSFLRNKLINGGMMIDQRNSGAAVTPTTTAYTVDRWQLLPTVASLITVQQIALASGVAPSAFATRLTSLSAHTSGSTDAFAFEQLVEANNIQEIAFGTASALPVSISFIVRSSLTGNFSGYIRNFAGTRSYPFVYNIPVANTLTKITVPNIPGDITGTWVLTGSVGGLRVGFDLGCGSSFIGTAATWAAGNLLTTAGTVKFVATNAATIDFTCVQFETGPISTQFEERLIGAELSLCQRYCYATETGSTPYNTVYIASTTLAYCPFPLPVIMRAPPSMTTPGGAGNYQVGTSGGAIVCSVLPSIISGSNHTPLVQLTVASGLTLNASGYFSGNSTPSPIVFSAEL